MQRVVRRLIEKIQSRSDILLVELMTAGPLFLDEAPAVGRQLRPEAIHLGMDDGRLFVGREQQDRRTISERVYRLDRTTLRDHVCARRKEISNRHERREISAIGKTQNEGFPVANPCSRPRQRLFPRRHDLGTVT